MSDPRADRELRELFRAQREVEASWTPSFLAIRNRAGPPRARPLHSLLLAAGAAAAAVLLVAGARLWRAGVEHRELQLARQVMEWRSPTDALLALPLVGLPSRSPAPGVSPEGSPLGAFDPGAPLGPTSTVRSPDL